MTGFEPWTSGIGSDRSTNWATTTSLTPFFIVSNYLNQDTEISHQNDQEYSDDGRRDGVDELRLQEVDGQVDVLVHFAQRRQQKVTADAFNGGVDKHLALVLGRVEVGDPNLE